MKKVATVAVFGVLLVSICFAQTVWQKTYGGSKHDFGNSIAQTSDGGFIVAGKTYSFGAGNSDVYVLRLDSSGDTVWTRTYGGNGWDEGSSVAQTSDGGFIIVGFTWSLGAGKADVYLLRLDSSGNTIWTHTYGGSAFDEGCSVVQTSDGGFIVAGRTQSFGAGNDDVYIIRTNSSGDTLWTKTYGEDSDDMGYSIAQASDGGFIVAGVKGTISGGTANAYIAAVTGAGSCDIYLIRIDSSGDTIWTRTYGGEGSDKAKSVIQTSDGRFIVAGYTDSFGEGRFDVYLICLNSSGDTIWSRTHGGSKVSNYCNSLALTSGGGFITAGETISFNTAVYILHLDSSGNIIWSHTYGGKYNDKGNCAVQTSDGGYIIVGETGSFGAGKDDVYIIKTDSLGNAD
ncbi:hypothetical protein J7L68_07585 [bacterium]|nr:hypothetical protein [bacterium]